MTERATTARLAILTLDLVVVTGSFAAAMWWNLGRGTVVEHWESLLFLPALQIIGYQLAGAYDAPLPGRAWQWIQGALNGQFLLSLLIGVGLYFGDLVGEVPRLAFASWAVAAAILVAGARLVARQIWLKSQQSGKYATRVVLAGSLTRCREIAAHLHAHPELELQPVGIASDDPRDPSVELSQVPIEDVATLALGKQAERVLICAALSDEAAIDQLVTLLAPFPLEVQLVPDLMQFPFLSLDGEDLAGIPALNLSASPMTSRDLMIKRIEDILLSVIILVLISPLLVVLAIAVRCSGPGPILFAQRRHGLLGRTITVYKFRTMTWSPDEIPEPDDARSKDPAQDFLNPRTGMFKQAKAGDARLTKLGQILRTTSLDELPQFFNVLCGDMSIVGPRPHARRHNLQFVGQIPGLMWRHYVKPGITGLAQISGARGRTRNVLDMERRVNLDLQYIRDWSLWLDLRIIVATIFVGFYNREP